MVVEALTGERVSARAAEELTDFVPGQESWPLAGISSLADRGLKVTLIEDFQPEGFLSSPSSEFMRQYGSKDAVESAMQEIDVQAEQRHLRACLRHPNVDFSSRDPTMGDVTRALSRRSTLLIPHCNYRELVGRSGYAGHYIVAKRFTRCFMVVDDPGLPARFDQRVAKSKFSQASRLTSTGGGSVIEVSGKE
jgi:hypothetical protein